MSDVLIHEPDPEVRELLEWLVRRSGHVPMLPSGEDAAAPAVLVIEPAWLPARAAAARITGPNGAAAVPIVCVSTLDRGQLQLDFEPHSWLLKPFRGEAFTRALDAAIAAGAQQLAS